MAMRMLGWGMLVILLDVRLNGFDVLPDVAGWALVTFALWDLAALGPQLQWARLTAIAGTIASAIDFALFFSEQPLPLVRALDDLACLVAWLGLCWWALEGLAHAAHGSDPGAAGQAHRLASILRVVNLVPIAGQVLLVCMVLAGHPGIRSTHSLVAVPLAVVSIVAVLANLALVGFCLRHADRPWTVTERAARRMARGA